jgi:hypothetical protein
MAKSANKPSEERPDVAVPADPQDADRLKAKRPWRWTKLKGARRKTRELHKRNIDPGL